MIETTPNHPFYTADGEWVVAGDLETGDRILALDGSYGMVEALEVVERVQAMYDLTVAEAHTFAVGAGQWVVHNVCDDIVDYEPKDWPDFDGLVKAFPNRDAGHHYAYRETPGGTGQAIAGHGEYSASANGVFTVPEGTYIRRWWSDATEIDDEIAFLIEAGQYKKAMDNLYSTWVDPIVYGPGSTAPNYVIDIPNDLQIHTNSITVGDPTNLSDIIKPGMGCVDLAICTVHHR